jgi:hypothetical protein
VKQRTLTKLREKLEKQQKEAETPLFKDICHRCGVEGCDCELGVVPKERWNWYGEVDGINHNV